jgi:hypothetical protein
MQSSELGQSPYLIQRSWRAPNFGAEAPKSPTNPDNYGVSRKKRHWI